MKQLYYNAQIVTMDSNRTMANAMVIEDGKILWVGQKEHLPMDDISEEIDMDGKTILPGFIDGHSHLTAATYDMTLANANPSPKGACDTLEQLVTELKKQFEEKQPSMEAGDWFMAMGYDESVYPNHQPPTKYDMDQITTEYPVCCIHASGHNAVLNSKAMELCGIDEHYEVPAGGAMPKLPGTEEYSGLLQENAFISLGGKMKMPGQSAVFDAFRRCVAMYASYGITTAQDAKTSEKDYQLLMGADQMGMLPLDVVCYFDPPFCETYLPKQSPEKNPYAGHVRAAGYKLFLDGSPQAKTAWLSKPYYQVPEGKEETYCGFPILSDEDVLQHIKTCMKNDWQINVHTNGDAAIEQLLRCYEQALQEYPEKTNLRPVFIHCQTVRKDQLDRIAKLQMQISFFEDHVYYWGDYHKESVLGEERANGISPLASAYDRGIPCTLHQDTPVVNPNVLFAVHNAVNRVTKKGEVLGPQERVSVYDALKAVTINGALQIFEEKKKGSLESGKYADFVVLDKNPLLVESEKIKEIQVLATYKEGKRIY